MAGVQWRGCIGTYPRSAWAIAFSAYSADLEACGAVREREVIARRVPVRVRVLIDMHVASLVMSFPSPRNNVHHVEDLGLDRETQDQWRDDGAVNAACRGVIGLSESAILHTLRLKQSSCSLHIIAAAAIVFANIASRFSVTPLPVHAGIPTLLSPSFAASCFELEASLRVRQFAVLPADLCALHVDAAKSNLSIVS